MVWLIALFVVLSYGVAIKSILENEYKPSLYSRVVWFFIALNGFASVIVLKNSTGIRAMATIALAGNVAILLLSLKKSQRVFGRTEIASSALLIISLVIWLTSHLPILNLVIGQVAHFIGAIPTFKKVIQDPHDEHIGFWVWFLLAGVLALFNVNWSHASTYLYPLYVVAFDGVLTLLCLRRYLK